MKITTTLGIFMLSTAICLAKNQHPSTSPSFITAHQDHQKVLGAYLNIKNALVASNQDQAQKYAEQLAATLRQSKSESMKRIYQSAQQISQAKDLAAQRKVFKTLSEHMYALAKSTSLTTPIYRQYCPMALANAGAYWLSSEKGIKNPYFGDKMLRCGALKETLQ